MYETGALMVDLHNPGIKTNNGMIMFYPLLNLLSLKKLSDICTG